MTSRFDCPSTPRGSGLLPRGCCTNEEDVWATHPFSHATSRSKGLYCISLDG